MVWSFRTGESASISCPLTTRLFPICQDRGNCRRCAPLGKPSTGSIMVANHSTGLSSRSTRPTGLYLELIFRFYEVGCLGKCDIFVQIRYWLSRGAVRV